MYVLSFIDRLNESTRVLSMSIICFFVLIVDDSSTILLIYRNVLAYVHQEIYIK